VLRSLGRLGPDSQPRCDSGFVYTTPFDAFNMMRQDQCASDLAPRCTRPFNRFNRGVSDPDLALNYIPGDGIEQSEDRWIWGWAGVVRTLPVPRQHPRASEVAFQTRTDYIGIGNFSLYRQVQRNQCFRVNLDNAPESPVSGYTAQQLFLADWLR
jgi:hypothetical protein